MKALSRLKLNFDYRHIVAIFITLGFILLGAFVYASSYIRLYEIGKDFFGAIKSYFMFLSTLKLQTDIELFVAPSAVSFPIKASYEGVGKTLTLFFQEFIVLNNFLGYLSFVVKFLLFGSTVGIFAYLLFLILKVLFRILFYSESSMSRTDETLPLQAYKIFLSHILFPVKEWIKGFISFVMGYSIYWKLWLFIWLLNLNIVSITLGVFGYLLYFVSSYNTKSILYALYKLLLDVSLMIDGLPIIVWLFIALIIIIKRCIDIAISRLRLMENSNSNSLEGIKSLILLIVGLMGAGKTFLATDMTITKRNIFRERSFESIRNRDLCFPNFPWLKFERFICQLIDNGIVREPLDFEVFFKNHSKLLDRVAQSPELIKYIERHNRKHPDRYVDYNLFGYDTRVNPIRYYNGLYYENLMDVLKIYAQAFMIYICDNYNFANYSIRFDDEIITKGYFPLWNYDFMAQLGRENISRYAKILNYDLMRLGERMTFATSIGVYTWGIFTEMESGKERLNQKEAQGLSKKDEKCNQLNDLYNFYKKIMRHSATVDFFSYIFNILDEQRADSVNADLRELCLVVDIVGEDEKELALPLFAPIDRLLKRFLKSYSDIYYKYRFNRGDMSLIVYALKHIASLVYRLDDIVWKRYGYQVQHLETERGNRDGCVNEIVWYKIFAKMLNERYATDSYNDYFVEANIGIKPMNEYQEYTGLRQTYGEMSLQRSHFVETLKKVFSKNKGDK